MPVISYARISSDGERDEHAVSNQHKVNRRTAQRLGWMVVAGLTDNDRSASKAGVIREAFEEMLKAVAVGRLADGTQVRGVVVLNEDRLRIPPTSNQAERDLRPAETQQKISGRLTSETVTEHRYAIRGYISTVTKHGADVMTAIRDAICGRSWTPPAWTPG